MTEVMGYPREEILGRKAVDDVWFNPEEREVFVAELSQKGFVRDFECKLRHKFGKPVITLTSAVRLDIGGAPYILTTLNDITQRKRMEEALRESEELGRSILNSVPHGLFGAENRRIFFANNAMETLFGWKPEELVGQSTRVLFRNEREWEEYGETLYTELKTQPIYIFEPSIPFMRKDGREILCRTSFSRVGGGRPKNCRHLRGHNRAQTGGGGPAGERGAVSEVYKYHF